MQLTPAFCRRFANRHLELGRNLKLSCSEFQLDEKYGHWILATPEAREICGEQDIVEEMISTIAACEWKMRFMKMIRQFAGEEPVAVVVSDRDGNLHEHMVHKFHPADMRAAVFDLAKIGKLVNTGDINIVMKTVEYNMIGLGDDDEEDVVETVPAPLQRTVN